MRLGRSALVFFSGKAPCWLDLMEALEKSLRDRTLAKADGRRAASSKKKAPSRRHRAA
jgi:hypothetical protein